MQHLIPFLKTTVYVPIGKDANGPLSYSSVKGATSIELVIINKDAQIYNVYYYIVSEVHLI